MTRNAARKGWKYFLIIVGAIFLSSITCSGQEVITVIQETVDTFGTPIAGFVNRNIPGESGGGTGLLPSPQVFTMANGGTGSFNGLFNGLLSAPLIDTVIFKNTTTSIDALTGNITVFLSVDTKIDIVFPATPGEALQNLINEIVIIGLPQGTENSLISKLDNVIELLNAGKENAAINVLRLLTK